MRWPWSSHDEEPKKRSSSEWTTDDWVQTFTEPRTLIPSVALTLTTVAAVRFYKSFLRRIPTVNHIKPDYFRRRSLFGKVTSVGDADNFRLFHTPGGRLAGWGLLPWKTVPTKREDLKDQTVSFIYSIKRRSWLYLNFGSLTIPASCSNCWCRCARAGTLGQGSTTIFSRSDGLFDQLASP
jgi:hypothetical protein